MWGRMIVRGMTMGLLAVAGAAPAFAQDKGLDRCSAMADAAARLACYDELARVRRAADVPAPVVPRPAEVGATGAQPPPPPAAQPPADFGFSAARLEERKPAKEKQPDRRTSIVASIRPFGAGYWQITMEDGAIWRLTETRAQFRPPRPGEAVEIRRGSLGSFLLYVGSQGGMRIKRVS